MSFTHDADRCPDCGSVCPAGVFLCPACILTEPPPVDADESESARIGSYILLDEIARGGMGVVYRARQSGLDRIVALKVLPGAAFASAGFRDRFQVEAQAAARLKNPGIVVVHEIGQWRGQPFLSMDFIDGPSLASRLSEGRMPQASVARIIAEVARSVAHAHGNGVAHRDLKPSNILLASGNQPVLTDFGLACFLDLEARDAVTQDLMGSPPYLPPERVTGECKGNPVLEDIYGLGAVLYHCLTGRPPFMADTLAALLAAVANDEPVPPRRLNPSVSLDLETICMKCLEKSPSARYGGAAEVAEELGRFLRGDPISARPLSPAARGLRVVRKYPLLASLVIALLATIITGTLVSVQGWRKAAANASDFRAVAESRRIDLYSANLSAASSAMETGNCNQARELLSRGRPENGESDLRGCEWHVMDQLLRGRDEFSLHAHDHILTALAWSPSGEMLLSGGHDGSLKSWRFRDGPSPVAGPVLLSPAHGRIHQIHWLADGSAFLAAEGESIRCRTPDDGPPLWEIPGVRFSLTADEKSLAVSTGGPFFFEPPGKISLWRMPLDATGKPRLERTFPDPARAVAISPDGRWLAAGLPRHSHHDEERDLNLFDLENPDAPPRHLATNGAIQSLRFSPDSRKLAASTQSANPRIHLFDINTGKEIPGPAPRSARVWSAEFSSDSRSLFMTSSDRSLATFALDGGLTWALPMAHDNEIWSAAVHPSGNWVASGDKDGTLKVHPLPLPLPPLAAFPRHPHFRYVRPVFSTDSATLLVCETSPAWKTTLWNPGSTESRSTDYPVYPEAIGPGGETAWRDTNARAILIRRTGGQTQSIDIPLESWPATPGMRNHGACRDGRHIYQFSESGHAATVEVATGRVRTLTGFCSGHATASAISPDGRFLVAATWQDLIIHDFDTARTTSLPNNPHWAKCMDFSPDGKFLASGGNDGHILLRRLPDFTAIWKLSGHLSEVSGLAFSPDGRTLVSSEIGSGLRFWRLDTRREVLRLPLPEACESLVFSPDGQKIALTTCPPSSPPEAGRVLVIPCPREP